MNTALAISGLVVGSLIFLLFFAMIVATEKSSVATWRRNTRKKALEIAAPAGILTAGFVAFLPHSCFILILAVVIASGLLLLRSPAGENHAA